MIPEKYYMPEPSAPLIEEDNIQYTQNEPIPYDQSEFESQNRQNYNPYLVYYYISQPYLTEPIMQPVITKQYTAQPYVIKPHTTHNNDCDKQKYSKRYLDGCCVII